MTVVDVIRTNVKKTEAQILVALKKEFPKVKESKLEQRIKSTLRYLARIEEPKKKAVKPAKKEKTKKKAVKKVVKSEMKKVVEPVKKEKKKKAVKPAKKEKAETKKRADLVEVAPDDEVVDDAGFKEETIGTNDLQDLDSLPDIEDIELGE